MVFYLKENLLQFEGSDLFCLPSEIYYKCSLIHEQWYMWAVVVWETLEFLLYRAVLFSRQTAKDRLLKEPLCSYSAWITLTFKFTKQVSTGKSMFHIHHAGNMRDHLEVLSLFMSVYLIKEMKCAARTFFLLLGVAQLSEQENPQNHHTQAHLWIVRQCVGSLETNRMSLVTDGAPHCASPMTPLRGRGSCRHGIPKWDCTLSEEKRCTEIGRQTESDGWIEKPE